MKQVILVRQDLKLPKGKMSVQVAHASTEAALKSPNAKVHNWQVNGAKKVALKIADENELLKFQRLAKEAGLTTALITDAGKTVVAPGTITCLAIGPDEDAKIDALTGNLKMV